MRTIKFRAQTLTGEFIYFELHESHKSGDPEVFYIGNIPCKTGTEEQFIGINDKNGKEIYKGDIIKDEKCDGLANGVVEFGKGTYDTGFYLYQGYYVKYPDVYFESGKYKRYENEFDTDGTGGILFDCEIIGNIFQNPELL